MFISCPHCQGAVQAPQGMAGKRVKCPLCTKPFELPGSRGRSSPQKESGGKQSSGKGLLLLLLFFILAGAATGGYFLIRGGKQDPEPDNDGGAVRSPHLEPLTEGLTRVKEEPLEVSRFAGRNAGEEELSLSLDIPPLSLGRDASEVEISFLPSATSSEGGDGFALPGASGGFGGRANFMGIEAKGNRFCIIADRSGSMAAQGRLEHVKFEIAKTLKEMRSGSRFYVIFFDDRAYEMPDQQWLTSPKDIPRVVPWVQTIHPAGGTQPYPAFEAAFRINPRPDVIFFMTDGGFSSQVPAMVKALNQAGPKNKMVTIHTIAFMDPSGERVLREIANDAKGTFRFVAGLRP